MKYVMILGFVVFGFYACEDEIEKRPESTPYEQLLGVYKSTLNAAGSIKIDDAPPADLTFQTQSAFSINRLINRNDTVVQIGAVTYDVSDYSISATYEENRTMGINGVNMTGLVKIIDEGTLNGVTLTINRRESGTLVSSNPTSQAEIDIQYLVVAEKQN